MCRSQAGKATSAGAASAGAAAAGIRERLSDLRRLPLGIVIVVVVALGFVGNYLLDRYRAQQLDVKDIDLGSALALIDDGAGKVVLFHVWMPSCEICRGELPVYNQLYHDFGREDVELLMLAVDDSEDSLRDFLVDEDLDFSALRLLPTTLEETRERFGEAGLSFKRVVPYTAVFGPDGKLVEEWTGVRTAEYYADLIRSLE
jgi:thiol-disulfide isomerase/thioredoxin